MSVRHSFASAVLLEKYPRLSLADFDNPVPGLPPARRGGKFLHAHAWSSCLENLAAHPAVWPTILELTDGKPKLLHESGTLFWEDSRRNDLGDTYDPDRDIHVSVAGTDGVHLHCGREVRCPGHTLLLSSRVRVFAASRLCHLT